MRANLSWATVVAGYLTAMILAGPALGQAPPGLAPRPAAPVAAPPSVAGTSVAVIDIAYIFKNHGRFKGQMDEIKRDIDEFESFVRNEQKKLTTSRDELVKYKPQSIEYKTKEEELARQSSDLQVKMALKRKEFLEREARVYYNTYNEVLRTTATFADQNRIGLVLRFNGDEMDAQDRGSVLQGVNRAVVFQRNLDITDIILQRLGGVAPTAPVSGARPPLPKAGGAPVNTATPGFPGGVQR